MAVKLKCGSTLASISSISLARSPCWISLSLVMSSTTSTVTFFTSWSGGSSCARASGAKANSADAPSSAALARFLIRVIVHLLFFCGRLLRLVARLIVRLFLPRRAPLVDQISAALPGGIAPGHAPVERPPLPHAAPPQQDPARPGEGP